MSVKTAAQVLVFHTVIFYKPASITLSEFSVNRFQHAH